MADLVTGSRVAAEFTFRLAGVPTDPTVITAYVRSPNGSLVGPILWPTTDLTREDIGVYRYEFTATVPGNWGVRFEGAGAVEAVAEQYIVIYPSTVL